MMENHENLKARTKQFALRVIKLVRSLPNEPVAREIGKQLMRSGMSVGANYRAACRGRSPAEFRAKMGIVEEEADESAYWMELLVEARIMKPSLLEDLRTETNELVAITVSSIRNSKNNER
tara:strand:+ start:1867 stop:2229 length:363 start_codon:yes stop_codon:yes gene_type:complete